MTTNAQASEEPFLSAMEREPPASHEAIVTVNAKELFRGDGMMWALLQKIRRALGMMSLADRGPEDFAQSDFERGVRMGARTYVNGDPRESREPNGEKRLLKWILGIVGSLFVLATVGGITLYGEFTALRATVTTGMNAHEQRINRVEQRLDRASAQPGTP